LVNYFFLPSFRIGKFYRKNDMSPSPLFKLNVSSLCSLVGLNTCKWFVIRFLLRNEIETKRNLPKWSEIETKRGKFRFFSVNFVSISFVSFRFRFTFHRDTHKDAVFQWCLLDSKSNWHNFHIFSSFYFIFSQSKNRITNQLHVFKKKRNLPRFVSISLHFGKFRFVSISFRILQVPH
jgi:hypothetical protein